MRVLIACEYSGIVREAFKKLGHDAWSCDLEPTQIRGNHFQCDVLSILENNWDLMIAHPPCTLLALSGNRWRKGREIETELALDFAQKLWNSPIKMIALEQPASILKRRLGKHHQVIHPYYFGVPQFKTTWLWIKGLPLLMPTDILIPPLVGRVLHDEWSICHRSAPGKNRGKKRSKTFSAIADAMANQWG